MKPLSHYVAACTALSREAFAQRHPGPFLVHSSRTGGALQTTGGGRTIDSVVLEEQTEDDANADVQTVFTVSQFAPKGPELAIGSELGSALRVQAASVSRTHARLRFEGGQWLIEDAGSSVGTWINGEGLDPGARHALRPGDRISLGALDVTFLTALEFYDFGCSPCTCGPASGVDCNANAQVTRWSNPPCSQSLGTLSPLPSTTCTTTSGMKGIGLTTMPTGGSCPPDGGQPTGTVSSQTVTTICCGT
jgi:hypothetical protein